MACWIETPNGEQVQSLQLGSVSSYLADWEASAAQAMQTTPEYFAKFYLWKSLALVGVTAALAVVLFSRK